MLAQVAEAVIAQGPILDLQIENARLQWEASHGPAIGRAALESAKKMNPLEWPLMAGFVALQTFELSPGNETWITNAGADHFVQSGGQDVIGSAFEVAERTAMLEFGLAGLAAWGLYRMKPVVRMIYDSYLAPLPPEEVVELQDDQQPQGPIKSAIQNIGTKVKNSPVVQTAGTVAASYGLAMSSGTGGMETAKDLAEGGENSPLKNAARGALAATAITASNFMFAVGVTSSIKYNLPGLKEVCDTAVNILKTPVLAASIFGGLYVKRRYAQRKRVFSQLEEVQ